MSAIAAVLAALHLGAGALALGLGGGGHGLGGGVAGVVIVVVLIGLRFFMRSRRGGRWGRGGPGRGPWL